MSKTIIKKLTASKILDIVEANISVDDFAYGDFDSEELGLGEFEEVDHTGGEDEGSRWSSTKYFKEHNVYIKTTGFYQSYVGTEFYNGYGREVSPKQVMVTIYE